MTCSATRRRCLVRAYSNNELERSIEACLRLEFRRRNLTPEEVEAGIDP